MATNRLHVGLATLLGSICMLCCPLDSSGQSKDEKVEIKNSLLPEAAAGATKRSDYRPARPYSVVGSVLARTVFQATAPGGPPATALGSSPAIAPEGYHVEVLDWAIPVRKATGRATLPGAAFVEVRSGSGTLVSGQQQRKIGSGTTFSASQGQLFEIKNVGEGLLRLRLYIVRE